MIKSISVSQKKVRDYYCLYYKNNGVCPNYTDAAKALEMSTTGVFKHIMNLEKLGYLTRTPSGQVIIGGNLYPVEVVGKVSCGYGNNITDIDIDTSSNFSEKIEVPGSILPKGTPGYALLASGDSMQDVGINDGDFLIISYQSYAQEGDIVVAVIKEDFEEKVTLKEYHTSAKGYVELRPKNRIFAPIVVTENDTIEIRGKLVGVIRNFNK